MNTYEKLRSGSQPTLRKEEAGDPEWLRLAVFDPVLYEGASEYEVGDPAAERLEWRVGCSGPQLGHLVVEERRIDHL